MNSPKRILTGLTICLLAAALAAPAGAQTSNPIPDVRPGGVAAPIRSPNGTLVTPVPGAKPVDNIKIPVPNTAAPTTGAVRRGGDR